MKTTFWYWFFAIIITLGAAYYQRISGPTHSKKVSYSINGKTYTAKLPRSHAGVTDCQINLLDLNSAQGVSLFYRRYPTTEKWVQKPFVISGSGGISAGLPNQPAAGKLEYYIEIVNQQDSKVINLAKEEPIVIRFKNVVPAWALIPHILLMFIAMLLSNFTGALALFKHSSFELYGKLTLIVLLAGGLIFGPLVQQFAFNQAWTGFPFGYDLTDNKTLIAFVAWSIAVIVNIKEKRPLVSLFAAIVMLIIFLIPHSLRGSELNFETGEVASGFITLFNNFF